MNDTVSQTKQKTNQYQQRLRLRVRGAKGWTVQFVNLKGKQSYTRFQCHHGQVYKESFYSEALYEFPSAVGFADQCFKRADGWCKGEHASVGDYLVPFMKGVDTKAAKKKSKWNTSGHILGAVVWDCQVTFEAGSVAVNSNFERCTFYGTDVRFESCKFYQCDFSLLTFSTVVNSALDNCKIYPDDQGFSITPSYPYSTKKHPMGILDQLRQICPALDTVVKVCPHCKNYTGSLGALIPHINDLHAWSREKIADWLDVISIDNPDIDLTIHPKKEEADEQPSISASQQEDNAALGYGPVTLGSGIIEQEYEYVF